MSVEENGARAWLALENGLVVEGRSVGASGEVSGDLVFNTAMTGYQEILTDPSYAGQGVVMTYPLIGNYGIADEDMESSRCWAEAFVMKELSTVASNHRSTETLEHWLDRHGVVAIDGVDTRQLTKAIGKSKLKKVNFKTGESYEEVSLSNKYFAEGITIMDNKIIQLTWRENTGLIYNLQTLDLIGDFKLGFLLK